jgi:energy-coupling factor transport system permease protein
MLTRNPLYLSLLLGIVVVHYVTASQGRPEAQGWGMLLRAALWLAVLTIPLNALSVHAGSRILFSLPERWPLIGGIVTLEGVLAGAISALGLLCLIVLFATFNLNVAQAQLLGLTPAFLYEAGLIVSIGLTFIPQMMVSARDIREAQLVRGHRMRRPRDALPYVMALLTTSLERSFQLAESLESRGFGRVRDLPPGREILLKGLILVGLAGLLSGFFLQTYFQSIRALGWGIVAGSVALLVAAFWAQGRRVLRVHYRRDDWTWRDAFVLALTSAVAVVWLIARLRSPDALAYNPYLDWLPRFGLVVGVGLMFLLSPMLVDRRNAPHAMQSGDGQEMTPG